MFEIIIFIIIGIAKALWFALKYLAIALYYTLPIIFIFLGFVFGDGCGDDCFGDLDEKYATERCGEFTHSVTIYWDETETNYSVILVREDLNWFLTTNDSINYSEILYDQTQDFSSVELPTQTKREGYVFKGLYDLSMGNGEQYVTESGYSLKRITERIELYAYWEAV